MILTKGLLEVTVVNQASRESPSVLIVEDDDSIRKLLGVALRRAGYDVALAADGLEALERIAEATPDLVISDVMMPRMDGFELLSRLRGDEVTREIPVILLTARGDAGDAIVALDCGADDYVAKPFDVAELLARVRGKIARPPVSADLLPRERQTGLLGERPFLRATERELERAAKTHCPGSLAYLAFVEQPGRRRRARAESAFAREVAELLGDWATPLDVLGRDRAGRFMLLMAETSLGEVRHRLDMLGRSLAGRDLNRATLRPPTPAIGYAGFTAGLSAVDLQARVVRALDDALSHPNAGPVRYNPGADRGMTRRRSSQPARPPVSPAAGIARPASILVVDDDDSIRKLLGVALRRAGYDVALAVDGLEALERIAEATPDLVISDVMMPRMDGAALLSRLRADAGTREVPVILLAVRAGAEDVVAGLDCGADDYIAKPFDVAELLARVRGKIARPPLSADLLPRERQTGLLGERPFLRATGRELERGAKTHRPGQVAYLALDELPGLRGVIGHRSEEQIARQVADLIGADARPLDAAGRDEEGRFMLLLPETDAAAARGRLVALARRVVDHTFAIGERRLRLTPSIGHAGFRDARSPDQLCDRALRALNEAESHLDLQPIRYDRARHGAAARRHLPPAAGKLWERLRLPVQFLLVNLLAIGLPFAGYVALAAAGLDVVPAIYLAVVLALVATAYFIWVEMLLALRPTEPPPEPGAPYPPASAIIAAYLPNEAATVVETIGAFLHVDYPAPLQIILAYNTPRDLPVEAELRDIARRDPRFVPLKVTGSTSKAQNVNAAIAAVTGDFVGVFDADHQPDPDSFMRAWRWLSNGYDIVQGHCLIRNGDESWVARMVAVEFEAIYAVSHPGRARLHDFGIFGGSNGYWRSDVLRRIRMRGSMLTEDIDSSLRALEEGCRIASDRGLISRELAPTRMQALVNQRFRWAQGWFQVSLKHVRLGLRSPRLSIRQKLGLVHLLVWREIYPYLSVQMFPIGGFWWWHYGSLAKIDWFVPIFVATSVFTLTTGPVQTLLAYLLAAPELRRRKRWFLFYLLISNIFYTGIKNAIGVVSHFKELMRERQWKVTPRSVAKKVGGRHGDNDCADAR